MTRTGPTRAQTVLYALPQVFVAFVTLGIVNYTLAFYAGERGIPLGLISGLFLLSRLSDVFTDPLIGGLSDRTRGAFGRRKPWILGGLPLFLVSVWFLFRPPEEVSGLYFFVWLSLTLLGLTCIQLPYVSWGAELSPDYDERTRIAATREGIGLIGSIAAVGVAVAWAMRGRTDLEATLATMAAMTMVAAPVFTLLALRVPSPPPAVDDEPLGLRASLGTVAGNGPFRLLLLAAFVSFVALVPGGAMNYFVFDAVYGRADLQAISVAGEFAAGILGLPAWNALAARTSKSRALALAFVWIGGLTCLVPLAGDAFGVFGVMGMAAVRALALGAVLSMPYAILADVVDVDTARTGRERTALYMAIAGVVVKLALTVGISVALAIPARYGFDPAAASNTQSALWSVEATFAYLPGVIWLLAAPLFWFFPLGQAAVAANRAAIQARARAA